MQEIFSKGGIIMWPLLALSVTALAIVLHRIVMLYMIDGRKVNCMQDFIDSNQQAINHVWLIASVAPLFGLLGTVLGIIKCFQALGAGRPDIQIVSFGLSEALITTAAGLFISIPCQIMAHLLQQRLDSIEKKLSGEK